MRLTIKQKAFADYYIELGNATEAAIKAGYSPKYAGQNADKLLKNTKIRTYIDERLKEIEDARIADAAEVLKYLTAIMRNELTEEVVVVEGGGEGYSHARTVEKDISARDRNKAAELLGKRYGLFTDKLGLDVNIPVVISGDDELED